MYNWIKCPTCNKSIGEIYPIFMLMVKELYKKKNNKEFKNIVKSGIDFNLEEIYDILHIKNYCCRMRIINISEFNDLYFT